MADTIHTQPELTGELSTEELLKALKLAIDSFPPAHPDAEGMSVAQYEVTLELRKARAAIAADRAQCQPEPKGPTRRQLLQLAAEFWPEGCEPAQAVPFARAALARWGRPAPATAGEVGELADFVRGCADDYESHGRCRLIRAADLLERQAAPQPVAVSERLPGPEDCDAEGRCWIHMPDIGTAPSWRLVDPREIGPYHTHWLPAHALPVPSPENSGHEQSPHRPQRHHPPAATA